MNVGARVQVLVPHIDDEPEWYPGVIVRQAGKGKWAVVCDDDGVTYKPSPGRGWRYDSIRLLHGDAMARVEAQAWRIMLVPSLHSSKRMMHGVLV